MVSVVTTGMNVASSCSGTCGILSVAVMMVDASGCEFNNAFRVLAARSKRRVSVDEDELSCCCGEVRLILLERTL